MISFFFLLFRDVFGKDTRCKGPLPSLAEYTISGTLGRDSPFGFGVNGSLRLLCLCLSGALPGMTGVEAAPGELCKCSWCNGRDQTDGEGDAFEDSAVDLEGVGARERKEPIHDMPSVKSVVVVGVVQEAVEDVLVRGKSEAFTRSKLYDK
jgi:hypothetical protein